MASDDEDDLAALRAAALATLKNKGKKEKPPEVPSPIVAVPVSHAPPVPQPAPPVGHFNQQSGFGPPVTIPGPHPGLPPTLHHGYPRGRGGYQQRYQSRPPGRPWHHGGGGRGHRGMRHSRPYDGRGRGRGRGWVKRGKFGSFPRQNFQNQPPEQSQGGGGNLIVIQPAGAPAEQQTPPKQARPANNSTDYKPLALPQDRWASVTTDGSSTPPKTKGTDKFSRYESGDSDDSEEEEDDEEEEEEEEKEDSASDTDWSQEAPGSDNDREDGSDKEEDNNPEEEFLKETGMEISFLPEESELDKSTHIATKNHESDAEKDDGDNVSDADLSIDKKDKEGSDVSDNEMDIGSDRHSSHADDNSPSRTSVHSSKNSPVRPRAVSESPDRASRVSSRSPSPGRSTPKSQGSRSPSKSPSPARSASVSRASSSSRRSPSPAESASSSTASSHQDSVRSRSQSPKSGSDSEPDSSSSQSDTQDSSDNESDLLKSDEESDLLNSDLDKPGKGSLEKSPTEGDSKQPVSADVSPVQKEQADETNPQTSPTVDKPQSVQTQQESTKAMSYPSKPEQVRSRKDSWELEVEKFLLETSKPRDRSPVTKPRSESRDPFDSSQVKPKPKYEKDLVKGPSHSPHSSHSRSPSPEKYYDRRKSRSRSYSPKNVNIRKNRSISPGRSNTRHYDERKSRSRSRSPVMNPKYYKQERNVDIHTHSSSSPFKYMDSRKYGTSPSRSVSPVPRGTYPDDPRKEGFSKSESRRDRKNMYEDKRLERYKDFRTSFAPPPGIPFEEYMLRDQIFPPRPKEGFYEEQWRERFHDGRGSYTPPHGFPFQRDMYQERIPPKGVEKKKYRDGRSSLTPPPKAEHRYSPSSKEYLNRESQRGKPEPVSDPREERVQRKRSKVDEAKLEARRKKFESVQSRPDKKQTISLKKIKSSSSGKGSRVSQEFKEEKNGERPKAVKPKSRKSDVSPQSRHLDTEENKSDRTVESDTSESDESDEKREKTPESESDSDEEVSTWRKEHTGSKAQHKIVEKQEQNPRRQLRDARKTMRGDYNRERGRGARVPRVLQTAESAGRRRDGFESESDDEDEAYSASRLRSTMSVLSSRHGKKSHSAPRKPTSKSAESSPHRAKKPDVLSKAAASSAADTLESDAAEEQVQVRKGHLARKDVAQKTDVRALISNKRKKDKTDDFEEEFTSKKRMETLPGRNSPIINITFNSDPVQKPQSSQSRLSVHQRLGLPVKQLNVDSTGQSGVRGKGGVKSRLSRVHKSGALSRNTDR